MGQSDKTITQFDFMNVIDKYVSCVQGEAPDTEVGRVYVEDLDDWDLPDKTFRWANRTHTQFDLNDATGMITMLQGTPEGSYLLEFLVCN